LYKVHVLVSVENDIATQGGSPPGGGLKQELMHSSAVEAEGPLIEIPFTSKLI